MLCIDKDEEKKPKNDDKNNDDKNNDDKDNKKYEDKNESQPKKKKKFVLYFNYLVLFVLEINIYIFID